MVLGSASLLIPPANSWSLNAFPQAALRVYHAFREACAPGGVHDHAVVIGLTMLMPGRCFRTGTDRCEDDLPVSAHLHSRIVQGVPRFGLTAARATSRSAGMFGQRAAHQLRRAGRPRTG